MLSEVKHLKNVDLISNAMHCGEKNMLMSDLRRRLNTNKKRHGALFKPWWLPEVAHQVIKEEAPYSLYLAGKR
jgi:hypothetical protein